LERFATGGQCGLASAALPNSTAASSKIAKMAHLVASQDIWMSEAK
jgi:hypothetical protein